MQNHTIYLCGFMGCGKSTIGKQLARSMNRPFIDLDIYIEQKEQRTIKTIFAQEGEAYFRSKETEAIQELSSKGGLIVAAGGGTFLNPQNVEHAKRNGLVLLLDTPLAAIQARLKGDTSRPLLQGENPQERIRSLYEMRMESYRSAADITVPAGFPPAAVVQEIQNILHKLPETP